MLEPDEAVQLFLKQVPETALTAKGADRIRLGIGIFIVSMLYKPLQEHGLGYAVPQDYESMTELVMKYIADKDDKTPAQTALFTNDYAGTLKLDQSEWDKAMANAKPYRSFLA
jgi:NitT/TauT family transport system substrate-binding protein